MRITNSMMITNRLRDLNSSLSIVNKYSSQLASNRQIVRLSDDPIGVMKSINARKQLRNLTQYKANVQSANTWNTQVETAFLDMNNVIQKIREETVNAGGVKNPDDQKNIGVLISEMRDQLLELCNSALQETYIFGGYNATQKPFTVDENGVVLYNGLNLYDVAPQLGGTLTAPANAQNMQWGGDITMIGKYSIVSDGVDTLTFTDELGNTITRQITAEDIENKSVDMSDLGLGVITWEQPDPNTPPNIDDIANAIAGPGNTITNNLYTTATKVVTKASFPVTVNDASVTGWDGPITNRGKFYIEANGADLLVKDSKGQEVFKKTITAADVAAGSIDLTSAGLGKVNFTDAGAATPEDLASAIAGVGYVTSPLGEEASQSIQFEIGYQLMFDVSFTGIDVVGLGGDNMFKILDGLIEEINSGTDADKLGPYLTKLTEIQDRLMKNEVQVGTRTTKLQMMNSRYELDLINAEQIRGDIEDIDQAKVIMQMKFAESIYQQALAAGARIIQPTLMDFLR